MFENKGISRTYLILNDRGEIIGYFSLSIKEISLTSIPSKSKIKKIDGLSKNATSAKAFLIGQIGKNFSIENNPLSMQKILEEAYAYIHKAQEIIGGRMILIECENVDKLIKLYEDHGFTKIEMESNPDEDSLIQMYNMISI